MTTDIEKQFFETFEIEPKYKDYRTKNGKTYESKNPQNRNIKLCYPQITDRILLELIRMGLNYDFVIHAKTVDELKEKLLTILIRNKSEFTQQVQELFKEG